nr:Cell wall integrity and stress response component 3 like [Ipomoea batatas]GME08267.1 Cell wall integrity and stress response component 3 like [Ipomoea batatas]
MESSSIESPIFTETDLGTRLAVPISPDATAREFKRVFEMAHLNCFPKLGDIKVNGLMVQRKSFFYHLSDTLPLRYAFQYLKGNWFLRVKVCHSSVPDKLGAPEHVREKIKDCSIDVNDGAGSTEAKNFLSSTIKIKSKSRRRKIKRFAGFRISLLDIRRRFYFLERQKIKKKRVRKKYDIKCSINAVDEQHVVSDENCDNAISGAKDKSSKEGNYSRAVESRHETLSESMSVSGIIRKYFSCYDEVNSGSGFSYSTVRGEQKEKLIVTTDDCHLNFGVCTLPPFRAKTPSKMLNVPLTNETASIPSRKVKKAEVGKRLLTAANHLGLNSSNRSPGLSLTRSVVFEIPDEED